MKKLQVMAEVDTTDFRSGLNHSADKSSLASLGLVITITHEDPGEADHGEASAEHEEHEEGGQHPGHHHVV